MSATAKQFTIKNMPKKIELKGDPSNPESAEHNIVFPGGSFSICRTSDNNYWVHIKVYTEKEGPAWNEEGIIQQRYGKIECIRVDTTDGVKYVEPVDTDHFAILISTSIGKQSIEKYEIGEQLKLI